MELRAEIVQLHHDMLAAGHGDQWKTVSRTKEVDLIFFIFPFLFYFIFDLFFFILFLEPGLGLG